MMRSTGRPRRDRSRGRGLCLRRRPPAISREVSGYGSEMASARGGAFLTAVDVALFPDRCFPISRSISVATSIFDAPQHHFSHPKWTDALWMITLISASEAMFVCFTQPRPHPSVCLSMQRTSVHLSPFQTCLNTAIKMRCRARQFRQKPKKRGEERRGDAFLPGKGNN